MDGIIFDVDGTLWDSTDPVAKSWNKAINENSDLKVDFTGESLKFLFGKTMDEITAALMPSLPLEDRTRIGNLCFDYENELLETEPGTLYPGVREVFETLSKKTELFIVSNCQYGYIEVFLKTSGLGKYIKDFLCFGQTQVEKDQTLRMLMEKNGLRDVVYIGDTLGDYNACRKAEVPFIFAEYGFGEAPDAERRIPDIRELPELLGL